MSLSPNHPLGPVDGFNEILEKIANPLEVTDEKRFYHFYFNPSNRPPPLPLPLALLQFLQRQRILGEQFEVKVIGIDNDKDFPANLVKTSLASIFL